MMAKLKDVGKAIIESILETIKEIRTDGSLEFQIFHPIQAYKRQYSLWRTKEIDLFEFITWTMFILGSSIFVVLLCVFVLCLVLSWVFSVFTPLSYLALSLFRISWFIAFASIIVGILALVCGILCLIGIDLD